MSERNNKKMKRAGIKQVLLSSLLLIIQMIIFLLSVGHINISRAWIFFGATFLYLSLVPRSRASLFFFGTMKNVSILNIEHSSISSRTLFLVSFYSPILVFCFTK